MSDLPLHEQVGFNYVEATAELLGKFTYRQLAEQVGYRSIGSITSILDGHTPSHIRGEALWALYIATFGRKPPLDVQKIADSLP